ncbi:hypothetical protein M408DRAFT_21615 [Serendipita vermifera MAFF 305830]|uniref:Uncharacterized protein n=1 Tax=Serendipita vermifera MAFF 305830 TaxID=933852 RepID=A0A0C2XP85_SERVB|nr:hypothetical protein M408DRAFT_21615 [Serendipita vermifera MAFF 305830]
MNNNHINPNNSNIAPQGPQQPSKVAKADFSDTDGRVCSEKVGQQPQNNTGAQQQQVADDQDHPVHNCETAGIPETVEEVYVLR